MHVCGYAFSQADFYRALAFDAARQHRPTPMDLPTQAVTLDVPQVEELARHFSSLRHDVNGCLALVVAATELIRYNPNVLARMANTLIEQPPRIAGKVREFVEQCERSLGIRPATEVSWYPALWKRTNQVSGGAPGAVTLTAEQTKALQNDLMYAARELAQTGFLISGARALNALDPANGGDVLPNVADQFTKAAMKFEALSARFDEAAQVQESSARRALGGAPTQPVTLTPDALALFHRRLTGFQRDLLEQLLPLVELSRLARQNPQLLVPRAGEFSEASPKISGEMNTFALEFDRAFGIPRAAQEV